MRIIAGQFKGRNILTKGLRDSRPTSDRVREAIFSVLASRGRIAGSNVLDLFAGSGALGLEALSRGARRAVFVDSDPASIAVIRKNAESMGLEQQTFGVLRQVEKFLAPSEPKSSENPGNARRVEKYDYIFADPPYRTIGADSLLAKISESGLLQEGGLIVFEMAKVDLAGLSPEVSGLRRVVEKIYGDTAVVFYMSARDSEKELGHE